MISAAYGEEVLLDGPMDVVEARQWLARLLAVGETGVAWVIEVDGWPSGQAMLHSLDKKDQRARLAVGLWREADLGCGYGTRAIKLVLSHAFMDMRLHRVDLRVLAFNARAIRAYERCGFTVEGREREACRFQGAFHDDVMMSILRKEWLRT